MSIWKFNVLPPGGLIEIPDYPSYINGLPADQVIIEYGAKNSFLVDGMMADVNQYLEDHGDPPIRIIVGAQHYEALIALASTARKLPIMPDKVSICGAVLDVIVDPDSKWSRVLGTPQDEYQRARSKEIADSRKPSEKRNWFTRARERGNGQEGR